MENTTATSHSERSLKKKVISSVQWQVAGQFATQTLRVGTNLILTRLLLPEAFGLIGMVQVFITSMELLSDVGLRGSVIHHERGESPEFLNTVWTAQVIRGWFLFSLTCLGAYPFAKIYNMPDLIWLLPLTGTTAIFRGMSSTSILLASRHLRPQWIVMVEVGALIIGNVLMVVTAIFTRSVIALSVGWVSNQIIFTLLSYQRRDIPWNKLHWDRDAAKSIVEFGRPSIVSSAIMILLNRGDRLVIGKILAAAPLGVFMIGANIALMPMVLFGQLNTSVVQPTYAKLRQMPRDEARMKTRKLRLAIVVSHVLLMSIFVIFGQTIIDILYPANLRRAGWYCSLGALAGLMRIGTDPGPVFPARGDARTHLYIIIARAIAQIVGMACGYFIGLQLGQPTNGILFGVVFAPLLSYPYEAWQTQRVNAWLPEVDFIAIIPTIALSVWMAWW